MFFHTPIEELRSQMEKQHAPFDILADPDKTIYDAYGVTSSWSALMSPRFMGKSMVAMSKGFVALPIGKHGGITGRPANFIIDEGGVVGAAHYGRSAGDSWSVDDALTGAMGRVVADPEPLFP
jgi:peroxiredoxin